MLKTSASVASSPSGHVQSLKLILANFKLQIPAVIKVEINDVFITDAQND